jgi:3-hydroxyisobutyrate dehydrogenase
MGVKMETFGPARSRALISELETSGAEHLEALVLGSLREGRLTVMVGAAREQLEARHALLSESGPSPRLIGPVGQAAGIKLALNQLIAPLKSAVSLSLGFVQRQGA